MEVPKPQKISQLRLARATDRGVPSPAGSVVRAQLLKFTYALIGHPREHSLEHRLFSAVTLLNGLTNLAGSLNVYSISPMVLVLTLVVAGAFLLCYVLSRFFSIYRTLFWPLMLIMSAFILLNSVQNGGSKGGAHYYLIPAAIIAAMLSRSLLKTAAAILTVSLSAAGIFYIEWFHADWLVNATPQERILDVSGQYIFVLFFCGILTLFLKAQLDEERGKSERLLLNVLPEAVAEELKLHDRVKPRHYESASVLFTDFVGFTKVAEELTPEELVKELDACFGKFDQIMRTHGLEKIKTIGDAYMAAAGIPEPLPNHVSASVQAALEIQAFMQEHRAQRQAQNKPIWELRLGLHCGPLVAGVIGQQKFVYDVWGDTVNTASRLEAAGIPGLVNISRAVYEQIKDEFYCEYRGRVGVKHKGEIDMFLVRHRLMAAAT